MTHTCKLCLYTTQDKSNYIKHLKSKKHIEKVTYDTKLEKSTFISLAKAPPIQLPYNSHSPSRADDKTVLQCEYCNRIFTRYDNLGRHIKSCVARNDYNKEKALEEKIKILNAELHEYKTNVKHYKAETEHYKAETKHQLEETNYYKQLLKEAGGLVKKSVSSLTYIVDNYNNAPALQTISAKEIDYFGEGEKKLIENIISSHKHKTIGKYLGNFIIKIYKKNDPKTQSIWNTDDTRLTYIIKELMHNNSSNWIVDKKGIKTKEYLIDPLLVHIKELLISYQTNLIIPNLNNNSVEIEFILENSKIIIDLMNDIDDGNVSQDILKHISSYLKFNTKVIE